MGQHVITKKMTETEQKQLAEIKLLIIGLNERVEYLEAKNNQISQQIKEFDIRIDTFR